jgi:hypothetical protein
VELPQAPTLGCCLGMAYATSLRVSLAYAFRIAGIGGMHCREEKTMLSPAFVPMVRSVMCVLFLRREVHNCTRSGPGNARCCCIGRSLGANRVRATFRPLRGLAWLSHGSAYLGAKTRQFRREARCKNLLRALPWSLRALSECYERAAEWRADGNWQSRRSAPARS